MGKSSPIKLSGLLGDCPKADPKVVQSLAKLTKSSSSPEDAPAESRPLVPLPAEMLTSGLNVISDGTLMEIPLDKVDTSPYQPRLLIDEEELQKLADSVQNGTLLDPIATRIKNDRFELVSGERRWRVHQLLGLTTIPSIIRVLDDRQAALLALAANTARKDLTDYEQGKSFQRLLNEKHVKNVSELVRIVGISRPQVDRCLDFMKLPLPIIEYLDSQPDLFGANCAEAFARFAEKGYNDLVIQAATMIYEKGIQEQQAIKWLKGAVTTTTKQTMPRQAIELTIGSRAVAEARIEKTRVIISCARGTKPSELLEKIRIALDNTSENDETHQ